MQKQQTTTARESKSSRYNRAHRQSQFNIIKPQLAQTATRAQFSFLDLNISQPEEASQARK
jgi:hypothetical protein